MKPPIVVKVFCIDNQHSKKIQIGTQYFGRRSMYSEDYYAISSLAGVHIAHYPKELFAEKMPTKDERPLEKFSDTDLLNELLRRKL